MDETFSSIVIPDKGKARDPGSMIDLTIITTGGTIDGADSDKGTSRPVSDAVKWLKKRSDVNLTHIELMNKDSREITDGDRRKISDAVANSKTNIVIITHGTYTICETGRALKQSVINKQKRVRLVGAWVPFGELNSDAGAQMEFALKSFFKTQSGVYVAMDGKLWNPDTTEKFETAPGVYCLTSSQTKFSQPGSRVKPGMTG